MNLLKQRQALAVRYLQRPPLVTPTDTHLPAPGSGLRLCVVIPSLAERENLPCVLNSLQANCRLSEVEVIVLVNNSQGAATEIVENNLGTLKDCSSLACGALTVHAVDYASLGRALPTALAGVGLARRLGMDLGLARLLQTGAVERCALACLDADSPVAPGYLDAILDTFDCNEPPVAGYCTYAHPRPEDPRMLQAMTAYELWLRYLEFGFKIAESWFAFPTIGSCTVVSALAYVQVGGMEPRKAAEDFHFLRKLAKLSGAKPLAHIQSAVVYPAARVSDRVPFGTGRAMQRSLTEGEALYLHVEPPEVFLHLRELFKRMPEAYHDRTQFDAVPLRLLAFLEAEGAWEMFDKFREIYPGPRQFTQAVQHWFDSLRIVRYANEVAREQGKVWAFDAWRTLLQTTGCMDRVSGLAFPEPGNRDAELHFQWLQALREF